MRSGLSHTHSTDQAALVIQPDGALTASTVMQFHQHLNLAIASDVHSSLLVDLQSVEHMDSDGLMALVSALKLAQKFNKPLFLCSLSRSVEMILELTQLDQVFQIVDKPMVSAAFTSQPAEMALV